VHLKLPRKRILVTNSSREASHRNTVRRSGMPGRSQMARKDSPSAIRAQIIQIRVPPSQGPPRATRKKFIVLG
jgi:hypothetical protein